MEFTDQGIVLAARAHGETHAVVDLLTAAHGRWAGLVYGGQGKKMRPILQTGNGVSVDWKGRIRDSLGHFTLELTEARAAVLMHDQRSLAGLSGVCATTLACLPERQAHAGVYEALRVVLDALDNRELWPAVMARFELGLLSALGFGLTLDKCAATGVREDLIYVSPKSAQSVSRDAGAPYHDRLLPLPSFLIDGGVDATDVEALQALTLTGYFLETRILHPADRTLPEPRMRMIEMLRNDAESG